MIFFDVIGRHVYVVDEEKTVKGEFVRKDSNILIKHQITVHIFDERNIHKNVHF
jgi:hypothetical protein